MGKPIFITDPVVAAAYHVHPGEFAYVALDAEASWLVTNRHGYGITQPLPLPAPYYVHPQAPLPFVPFVPSGSTNPVPPPPPAPSPAPAPQTIAVGPEDSITKIDVDGDGRADVLVITDRPPQNP